MRKKLIELKIVSKMRIAIHHALNSFSERWIEYCQEKNISYKIVNAYDSNIIEAVKDCDVFLWHHHHANYKDVLFAKQLLYSLQIAGIKVFPDFNTTWHFDDKVGQKYLLESIGAPMVPSHVFYSKQDALSWIEKSSFPKVFKLRGGAGASNVKLAHTKSEARKLVKKAFGKGFSQFDRCGYFKERLKKWRQGQDSLMGVFKGLARLFVTTDFAKMHSVEKGYIYFQDFMPNNSFDIRVVVVAGKYAMGERRMVRKGDFRASGSGVFDYSNIDPQIIKISFDIAKKLQLQSVAFDFIYNANKEPLIVELSFGFGTKGIKYCPGYWTNDMQWHEGKQIDFCGWMIDEIIKN